MSTTLPDQSPTRTKTIGQYEIGSTIGKGTFASVRQAKHIPTQQKVAIKILAKNMIVDTRDKLNISREIRILRKVRHPNIAQLLQIMQTTKNIYLIMQWVPSGQLFHQIISSQKNRLDQFYACKLFLQLLNAVQYLHDIGVTHRDIKPENILLDQYKNAKLIDFGLSNFYQTGQTLQTACGSPCYAAPEMLSENKYDPKIADLWSCGIVLYAMVCGFLPFQDENTKTLYEKVTKGQYDQPSFLSQQTKDILKKMLSLKPQDRLSIQQIRKHPFVLKYKQNNSSSDSKKIANGNRKSTGKLPKKLDLTSNFVKTRGLFPGQIVPIEDQIIDKMKDMGLVGCRKDIQKHINSKNTATYYLLLYQKLRKNQQSLNVYYEKISKTLHSINKPVRSFSLVLKRNTAPQNSIQTFKSKMLPTLNHEARQNNEQQIEFLEKISKKNKQKIRSLATGIRIRKVVS